ncbi:MAG: alkaline phosphatase, partial [Candidatus Hydrogenedentes bacterium]|nr:alkaline phosphatase [Candidatus Hydrogenedentota bacterium]
METNQMHRLISVSALLLGLCAAGIAQEEAPSGPHAKNIIVMIADGWGFNHVEATDYYQYGELGQQVYEREFKVYGMDTHSASGKPYDPEKAWADFAWVKEGATDSAAAATAMSTGSKTVNGAIGVDEKELPLEHIADLAEKKGKATGVITSVLLSHATPAGFSAHDRSRGNYEEIAKEMIGKSGLDVVMGCGHPDFDKDGKPLAEGAEKSYRYVGGEETWKQLLAGQAGGDCDGDGTADPWSLVQTREAFQALANGETPKRVIGVVPVQTSLQVERKRDDNPADDMPFQDPLLETVPTLAEISLAAINVLDNDPDGFFLMIEGGAVDWASHAGHGPRMIEEMIDYNKAVEAVVAWVEKNSNWNETLVIVTGDHECGYLTGPDSDPEYKPVVNNGKGNLPGVKFNKGSHTNSLIPIFVKGAGAELFDAAVIGTDPKR